MNRQNFYTTLQELRKSDYDSYLCATFSWHEDLPKIAAIFLLQSELKKISDITDEDMVGLIRLAWWRENIEDVFVKEKNKNHHLLNVFKLYKNEINYELLKLAFEGFEQDFSEEKKIANQQELQDYIFKTHEVFFLIILEFLSDQKNDYRSISKHLAQIYFYFDILKKIKNEDEKVVRFFYPDFFSELKINPKSWQKNGDEENLVVIVKHLHGKIEEACAAIDQYKKLPKRLKNLMLKKDLIQIILRDLPKKSFDIFAVNFSAKKLSVQLRLLFKSLF